MDGVPISTPHLERFIEHLEEALKTKVYFVTIKNNNLTNKKFDTISKACNWVKRYSTKYYIVQGLLGGTHYHCIFIHDKPLTSLNTVQHIHFNIQTLDNKKLDTFYSADDAEGARKSEYFSNIRKIKICNIYNIPKISLDIASMVARYWQSKVNKIKRLITHTSKIDSINRLMAYMDKNHHENQISKEYESYILKC